MGMANTFTATGQGSLSLGGIVQVMELDALIVTPADFATLTGVAPVRRVHQQCWFGIGLTANAGPVMGSWVTTFFKYLEMESEVHLFHGSADILADSIVWDIAPGGVMYFEADW
jgi:hypothetical protein